MLSVIYLVFNEGYLSTDSTELVRDALCEEAIRLARETASLMPDQPETMGLLALLLLTHSRHSERQSADGQLRRLAEQDRSNWDHAAIAEGVGLVEKALARRNPGRYQIEAAIAAVHAEAKSVDETDWTEIAALYATLRQIEPSPILALNHAVALSESGDLTGALSLVDEVAETLEDYHLLHATRADLLRRLGRVSAARAEYDLALGLVQNPIERDHLLRRRTELADRF